MSINLAAFWILEISASKEFGRFPQDSHRFSSFGTLEIHCSKGESELSIVFIVKI